MSKLRLTFACGPYDRTQAVRDFLAAETRKWAEVIRVSGAKVE